MLRLIAASFTLCVQEKHVNLVHIESRKSQRRNSDFEIFVDCDTDHEQLKELTQLLRTHTDNVEIMPFHNSALPDDGRRYFTFDYTDVRQENFSIRA